MNKKKVVVITGIAVAIVIFIVVALMLINRNNNIEIDLSKYYDVSFEGLNGKGEVDVKINKKGKQQIVDAVYDSDDNRSGYRLETLDMMKYSVSKKDNLSNGDEIVLSVTYSEEEFEECNFEVKNNNLKITVSGLDIPEEIDPFEDLDVSFEGSSPFIECKIKYDGSNEFLKDYVDYSTEEDFYNDGDKVVVVAYCEGKYLTQEKIVFTQTEKEYTASSDQTFLKELDDNQLQVLSQAIDKKLQLELSACDEELFEKDLGWCNHYTGLLNQEKVNDAMFIINDLYEVDEKSPYNMYVANYKIKISYQHTSRGEEGTGESEYNILFIISNICTDKNGNVTFDDSINVRIEKSDKVQDHLSVFEKEKDELYDCTRL